MEITIAQSCPSCGASLILHEDDRLIICEYCNVASYRVTEVLRYHLPASQKENIDPADILYVPYVRLKGTLLSIDVSGVQHEIVDTTQAAVAATGLPASLGLKAQAMTLAPVVGATVGKFAKRQFPVKTVFSQALKLSRIFTEKRADMVVLDRQFIGETISLIYQPYALRDGKLFDAVNGRLVGRTAALPGLLANAKESESSWEPRFISTICPECGGLLQGEADSLVLKCLNCMQRWGENDGHFRPVDYTVTVASDTGCRYLAFWEIALGSGSELATYADYLRFTNQPVVVQEKHERLPLKIFIPAFKVNPKVFMQLASQMTMSQLKLAAVPVLAAHAGSEMLDGPAEKHYPVTLGMQEAVQSARAVIAMTTIDKKRSLPHIKKLKLSYAGVRLNYFPFAELSHDYVQETTRATVSRAALRYGRKL